MRQEYARTCENFVRFAQNPQPKIMTLYEILTRGKKILERMAVI